MKVGIVQPEYSFDAKDAGRCFEGVLKHLDAFDESYDLIVLPEYSDVPTAVRGAEAFIGTIETYNGRILEKARETAVRCHAMVFVNAAFRTETGWRNTTHALDRNGNTVGRFFKSHPAPSEEKTAKALPGGLDVSYSYEYAPVTVVEMEGIRFAFLTCYDFYMYEIFPMIAREKPDVIIGCSHQRTDSHNALDVIGRFVSYQTNAYLVRASVSLGASSEVGGCSMVVSPKGEMILDMKNEVGIGTAEIDPKEKYWKPAGFGGKLKSHPEYIEDGRRPWLYRFAGPMTVPDNEKMPYPRLCAHRGFSAVAPENSMPAYGAAVSLGAEEIEFDLRLTKDRVIVSCHDAKLERISNGTGLVSDYTYEELQAFDFGVRFGESFCGLKILTFEEILRQFAGTVVMNVHVKFWDGHTDAMYEEIAALIRQYGAEKYCYMLSANTEALLAFRKIAPEIEVCLGITGHESDIVDVAIENRIPRLQFFVPKGHTLDEIYSKEKLDKAHAHGIVCNFCQADTEEFALELVEDGVDVVMTNEYGRISAAVDEAYPGLRYHSKTRQSLNVKGKE